MSEICHSFNGKSRDYLISLNTPKQCCEKDHIIKSYRCVDCWRVKTTKRKLEDSNRIKEKIKKANYQFEEEAYYSYEVCRQCVIKNRGSLICYEPFSQTLFEENKSGGYHKIYEPFSLQKLARRVIHRNQIVPDAPQHYLKKLKLI